MWPPTAIQADSEDQLDPSLSARTYFSSGLRKLSQKLMDTSVPRMARAIDRIHVWVGWADVLIHISNMKKLSFEEVESFLVFSSLEHSPCLQKCSSFQIWQVPLVSRGRERLTASVLQLLMGSRALDCLPWLSFLYGVQIPRFSLHR